MDLLEANTRRILRHIAKGNFNNTERWIIGLKSLIKSINTNYPCEATYIEKECERRGIFDNPIKREQFHDLTCWLYIEIKNKYTQKKEEKRL